LNSEKISPWTIRKVGKQFCNLHGNYIPSWRDVARWKLGLEPRELVADPALCKACEPALVAPDFATLSQPDPSRIVATWVGHATFLLQIGGHQFLTDPHFGSYCAPLPLARYRRQTPPGLEISQLPLTDVILLSHNHYDHLDHGSLRALAPGKDIYCPLGVGRSLRGVGAQKVVELAWGESAWVGEVRLVCMPAQHGSGRTPFDRNRSLWCGWMIEHGDQRAFFAGDTGYSPLFREIGNYFGSINLAMLPIGAYRPSWFMRPLHADPAEAVQMHLDLRAKQSVAMHWGAFLLADEPLGEPALLLRQARAAAGVSAEAFRLLGLGETLVV